jgi:HD-GYP domain-containing protein (c-di-GMP phosphodiesterase class II)
MPNSGSLSSMLEFCQGIIDRFIEFPDGPSFEEMALECLAALHPPTYVHSMMVAKLSVYLCQRLIDRYPEWLVGALGCESTREVVQNRAALEDFTDHAARCHDVGKLSIIDTVFVYGRNLLDMEFDLIRTHPRTGYDVLRKHESTRDYADIALYHHRFYNDSAGYPDDCLASDSPLKPVIDIVHIADCLDAATDPVGRTYRSSKTLETVIREFENGKGLCYADWVTDLFAGEELQNKLRRYLSEGRRDNYRMTYFLLRDMQKGTDKED